MATKKRKKIKKTIKTRVPMLAKNLKYLRKDKSQKHIADELYINRNRYQFYESGKTEPPYSILIAICDLYGITLDEILLNDIEKDENEDPALVRMDLTSDHMQQELKNDGEFHRRIPYPDIAM